MKNLFNHRFLIAALATIIGAGQATAQVHTKTVQMGSNVVVTVTTSVQTNSGGVAVSGACNTLDPQVIIRALGGADGGTIVSGGTVDPQVIMKVISGITGKNLGGNPQMLNQSLAEAARGAGMGVTTGWAQASTNPVTWLGLSADEVSMEVRAQLPLPEGAGLLVTTVTPDGPAAQAGVRANDILVKLDDQLLINPAQLRALILGKKDGDKITLSLLRKGKELQVTAKLTKRVPPPDETIRSRVINLGTTHLDLSRSFGVLGHPGDTNTVSPINIRVILEAVSNALQQAQQELNAPTR